MTVCHRCRRTFTHAPLRVERGVVLAVGGEPIPADRNYCSPECWAADHDHGDAE